MGLPGRVPTYKEVENKMNFYEDIPAELFQDTKTKLKEYLKVHNNIVVRDHCHWTGKFRGAAHQHCNIMFRKTYNIPCFFHNFTGYDSHHLFKSLSSLEKAPTVVAKSLEKFTSMDIGHIRIQDSLQFLNCSLDKLVSNLREKGEKDNKTLKETFPTTYTYFKREWSHIEEDAFDMLSRKGVYPYEYIDSWDKFEETKLPSIEHFYSTLSDSNISETDYEFAQKLCEKFR